MVKALVVSDLFQLRQ